MIHLFISDLHLCATRPRTTDIFFEFLEGPARTADALYILGDLFEYWAGDDDLDDPFNVSICKALTRLAGRGVRLYYMHGNRDFVIGERFARQADVSLIEEETVVVLSGARTLLMHGDALCTDDHAYMQFRATVREPGWIARTMAQPLSQRKAHIEELRRVSEHAKAGKTASIMDVNQDAVAAVLRKHGYPRLIHGHTHRPARHEHEIDGRRCERWVLADWYDSGSYLECMDGACRARSL